MGPADGLAALTLSEQQERSSRPPSVEQGVSIWADSPGPSATTATGGATSASPDKTVDPSLYADFDPFAPSTSASTLGAHVQPTSRLEILPNSDAESAGALSPAPSPTTSQAPSSSLPAEPVATPANAKTVPVQPPPKPRQTSSSYMPSALQGPSARLFGVFRTASGGPQSPGSSQVATPTRDRSPQRPAPPEQPLNEKDAEAHYERATLSAPTSATTAATPPTPPKTPPPDVVFDFNKFLQQMRSKSADPVAKYLRSFLKEFARKPPRSVSDQARVINDFLDFISGKMRSIDPWRTILAGPDVDRGELEFEMAVEAMEKLVMNRLWHLTFMPAMDAASVPAHMSAMDDLERDKVLSQRIQLFAWIRPTHLDLPIPDVPARVSRSEIKSRDAAANVTTPSEQGEPRKSGRQKEKQAHAFVDFACKELRKINEYKAPRDKMICILNCCKVIFGLMRFAASDESADSFVPFLIYVVLRANPDHLISNLQYIQRFRNAQKLMGEGGYYLSSLGAAISFVETMDASALSNITQAEFESNVEKAIQELPPDPFEERLGSELAPPPPRTSSPMPDVTSAQRGEADSPALIREPGLSLPDATRQFLMRGTDSVERMVSRPLNAIGRIFDQLADDTDEIEQEAQQQGTPRGNVAPGRARQQQYSSTPTPYAFAGPTSPGTPSAAARERQQGLYANERMSPRQIEEEIDRQHAQQRAATLETLRSMFPNLENEVLEVVLLSNSDDLNPAIERLLEMS